MKHRKYRTAAIPRHIHHQNKVLPAQKTSQSENHTTRPRSRRQGTCGNRTHDLSQACKTCAVYDTTCVSRCPRLVNMSAQPPKTILELSQCSTGAYVGGEGHLGLQLGLLDRVSRRLDTLAKRHQCVVEAFWRSFGTIYSLLSFQNGAKQGQGH